MSTPHTGQASSALRVLVLGNSNTGRSASGKTWTELVLEALASDGLCIEFINRDFYAGGEGADRYAMSQVERFQPECVLIALSATPAIVPNVAARLEQLLGKRAAPVISAVSWFDWKCMAAGRPGRLVYRTAHGAARRLLGARPTHSLEDTIVSYLDTFTALARHEEICVVVASYVAPAMSRQDGRMARESAHFDETMKRAVLARHFAWASRQATVMDIEDWKASFQVDGVHMTAKGHTRMAAAVIPILAAAIADLAADRSISRT